ncbi:MAG: FAD-dependent monooxygenase [Pseudomonadota bacterium]
MAKSRTILIAGGGIAGLTSALCLANQGFRCVVFERTEKPAATGAGIQLSPNAMHVLASLGLERGLLASGYAPDAVILCQGRTGRELSRFVLGSQIKARYGQPYLVLHRADLLAVLLGACREHPDIDVRFDNRVRDVAQHRNGITVLSNHQDRMEETTGLALVGADGVWSSVRSEFLNGANAAYSGKVAWRALIDSSTLPSSIDIENTIMWLGSAAHFLHYPIRQSRYLNVVAVTSVPESFLPRRGGWIKTDAAPNGIGEFRNWSKPVLEVFEKTQGWGGWPVYTVPHSGTWGNDRIVLIGDAAHAMTPHAAQGGGAAIEDAAVLAHAFSKHPEQPELAIADYDRARRSRIKRIAKLSEENRRIYQMRPPFSWARDVAMKTLPQDRLQKRLEWLYGWQQPSLAMKR